MGKISTSSIYSLCFGDDGGLCPLIVLDSRLLISGMTSYFVIPEISNRESSSLVIPEIFNRESKGFLSLKTDLLLSNI